MPQMTSCWLRLCPNRSERLSQRLKRRSTIGGNSRLCGSFALPSFAFEAGLLVAILFAVGCGKSKPATIIAAPATAAVVPPVSVKLPPPPALVATAREGSAEATFQQTLIAFQEGRIDAAFEFLPASYQADVQDVMHEFAERMDAELWSKSFQLLNQMALLLKTKKELILKQDSVKRIPQIESILPHWEAVVAGLEEVASSEVADLTSLKQAEVRHLLAEGSRLLSRVPLPQFGDVKVRTLVENDQSAMLSFQDGKEPEAKQVEFVKVEGKWLPKSIVEGWSAGIAASKARLADLPSRVAFVKPQVMEKLDTIGGLLTQLQKAKSTDEFNAAAAPLVFLVSFGSQMAMQAAKDSANSSRTGSAVRLQMDRELTDEELTKLRSTIRTEFENPDMEDELIRNDGKTRCRFTPVPDIDKFVTALEKHFSGSSIRLDRETKTIYIDRAKQRS